MSSNVIPFLEISGSPVLLIHLISIRLQLAILCEAFLYSLLQSHLLLHQGIFILQQFPVASCFHDQFVHQEIFLRCENNELSVVNMRNTESMANPLFLSAISIDLHYERWL